LFFYGELFQLVHTTPHHTDSQGGQPLSQSPRMHSLVRPTAPGLRPTLTSRHCIANVTVPPSLGRPAARPFPRLARASAGDAGQAAAAAAAAPTPTTSDAAPPLSAAPAAPAAEPAAIPATTAVYAIKDAAGAVQYVGMSRRLAGSVASHLEDIGLPTVATVAWAPFPPTATRDDLTAVWRAWVEQVVAEAGAAPPGNLPGATPSWTPVRRAAAPPEIRLTGGKGLADLTVPLATLIEAVVKDHACVAFIKGTRSAPQCGFSHRVLTQLTAVAGPPNFQVVNVLDETYNPGLREAIKAYTAWPTIPQVFVRGEFVGGCDVLEELVSSGELARLLKEKK